MPLAPRSRSGHHATRPQIRRKDYELVHEYVETNTVDLSNFTRSIRPAVAPLDYALT